MCVHTYVHASFRKNADKIMDYLRQIAFKGKKKNVLICTFICMHIYTSEHLQSSPSDISYKKIIN